VGDLVLHGKSEALRAFEPLRAEAFESPATVRYLEAFAQLEADDPNAMAAFAAQGS
jgi:adenylate cyclase